MWMLKRMKEFSHGLQHVTAIGVSLFSVLGEEVVEEGALGSEVSVLLSKSNPKQGLEGFVVHFRLVVARKGLFIELWSCSVLFFLL